MHKSPQKWVLDIRILLQQGGSSARAASNQRFVKEKVHSHGWRTDDLRELAAKLRREITEPELLLEVADRLFSGKSLEEKTLAVLLLEKSVRKFEEREFQRFVSWIPYISNWSDHDALIMCLIGPMMAAEPKRARYVTHWARQPLKWYRRAAAVALIRGARREMFEKEMCEVCGLLLEDRDDMVQKDLGWMLREWAKHSPQRAVPYLARIRDDAPRLVLRTACEKLTAAQRCKVLV